MNSLAQVLKPLDPASSLPLYQQLQRAIREAIATHVLGPDDALPAERQIARHAEGAGLHEIYAEQRDASWAKTSSG